MTSLAKLTDGELTEFKRRLSRAGLTAEMVREVNAIDDDDLAKVMVEALRLYPAYRLIHRRFNPLEDKLAQVRSWPGVTEEMIQIALEEGKERIALFKRESPTNRLLDIVVSVYKPTAHETLAYAIERMEETFGDQSRRTTELYTNIGESYIRRLDGAAVIIKTGVSWLEGISVPTSGVRIEVVDLGANYDLKDGMVPAAKSGPESAHASVLFAAAQDPEWIRQMGGIGWVPYVIAAGFKLTVSDDSFMPRIYTRCGNVILGANRFDNHARYYGTALPTLRGC
ncbi:MAG: hypothetical protein V1738_06565 [Patescibacteria group bacterium]